MKHDIDLWAVVGPVNSGEDRKAKLLNIVFAGGTFGNFLRYFCDKFSSKTEDINEDPFTIYGTSHDVNQKVFSKLIRMYHQNFIRENEGETGLPVCLILPSTKKHFLYLKKAQLFRAGDQKISPNDLWQKPLGEIKKILPDHISAIIKLYQLKEDAYYSWLPKFIVRDWYKLGFLQDLKATYDYQWFDTFKRHKFFDRQNIFHFDLEAFFKWDTFLEIITNLDKKFGLALDFDRLEEMKNLFDKGLRLDTIRQECNMAEQIIDDNKFYSFNDLDVSTQGFIYAELEKQWPNIQMPLTNRFFRDTQEISQYIEHFPNWYRRKNPNID